MRVLLVASTAALVLLAAAAAATSAQPTAPTTPCPSPGGSGIPLDCFTCTGHCNGDFCPSTGMCFAGLSDCDQAGCPIVGGTSTCIDQTPNSCPICPTAPPSPPAAAAVAVNRPPPSLSASFGGGDLTCFDCVSGNRCGQRFCKKDGVCYNYNDATCGACGDFGSDDCVSAVSNCCPSALHPVTGLACHECAGACPGAAFCTTDKLCYLTTADCVAARCGGRCIHGGTSDGAMSCVFRPTRKICFQRKRTRALLSEPTSLFGTTA